MFSEWRVSLLQHAVSQAFLYSQGRLHGSDPMWLSLLEQPLISALQRVECLTKLFLDHEHPHTYSKLATPELRKVGLDLLQKPPLTDIKLAGELSLRFSKPPLPIHKSSCVTCENNLFRKQCPESYFSGSWMDLAPSKFPQKNFEENTLESADARLIGGKHHYKSFQTHPPATQFHVISQLLIELQGWAAAAALQRGTSSVDAGVGWSDSCLLHECQASTCKEQQRPTNRKEGRRATTGVA